MKKREKKKYEGYKKRGEVEGCAEPLGSLSSSTSYSNLYNLVFYSSNLINYQQLIQ